jgi:hypothetical protein
LWVNQTCHIQVSVLHVFFERLYFSNKSIGKSIFNFRPKLKTENLDRNSSRRHRSRLPGRFPFLLALAVRSRLPQPEVLLQPLRARPQLRHHPGRHLHPGRPRTDPASKRRPTAGSVDLLLPLHHRLHLPGRDRRVGPELRLPDPRLEEELFGGLHDRWTHDSCDSDFAFFSFISAKQSHILLQ